MALSPWSVLTLEDTENYDLRTGEEGERPGVLENIRNVPLPEADPLFGGEGPLLMRWSG